MNADQFKNVLDTQIKRVQDVLVVKAAEYATEDRLANFKKAAHLQGVTTLQALAGMMAKHTVSIYDMVEDGASYSMEKWDEKITDHLNYLILLRALVQEESSDSEQGAFSC